MKHVIIVGSNHAGIAAAKKLLKNKDFKVSLYEKGSKLSYLGCMSALSISHEITTNEELFYTDERDLRDLGAHVNMNTEIIKIDFKNKSIDAKTNKGFITHDVYDILILATGSQPTIVEYDSEHTIHTLKNYEDTRKIDDALDHHSIHDVVVIGGGLIGLETAISASMRNKRVRVIEKEAHILSRYFDTWISDDVNTLFKKAGITIECNTELNPEHFATKTSPYPHQIHISAIGVTPNTTLGANTLELGPHNTYHVNQHSQTSEKDVYAVGDCASVYSNALQQDIYSPQASHALHSGTVAAMHIQGSSVPLPGTQSSIGTHLLGLNLFASGANTRVAKEAGLDVETVHYKGTINHSFIDKDSYYKCSIVYDRITRRVIGAQLASLNDISMLIHMYSLAIAKQCTVDELRHLDVFYHPHFNKLNNTYNI